MLSDKAQATLEATLANRRRKLINIYQDVAGRTWAASRPMGQRSARYDQRHMINSQGGIIHTEGAPDNADQLNKRRSKP